VHIKSSRLATVAAWAAMLMTGSLAAAAGTPSKGVLKVTDPGTGLEIRVQQSKPGEVSIELGDRHLMLRRQLTAGRLETIITTPSEKVSFVRDAGGLTVTTPRGRVRLSSVDPAAGDTAVALLGQSAALRQAVALLARVRLADASPIGHALLFTRAFLLSMMGERDAALAVVRTARADLQTPRVVQTRLGDGPGDCWNAYAKEAIAAFEEYEDCMKNVPWYSLFGADECTAIYDMRAIGAFSWWLSCVGLSGASS